MIKDIRSFCLGFFLLFGIYVVTIWGVLAITGLLR